MPTFTEAELEFLRSQPLGRLATQKPNGTLQNSPVGFGITEADTQAHDLKADARDVP